MHQLTKRAATQVRFGRNGRAGSDPGKYLISYITEVLGRPPGGLEICVLRANIDVLRECRLMPRANRCFPPGQIWHITHRCHERAFLLKFKRDRLRYLGWVFEARKRFGLCLLNYAVTSNHVHLLVKDTVEEAIARSMQLIAGRTAQEFNLRKRRQRAFWEDSYHATAVEAGEHLHCCVVYIDLNMDTRF